MDSHHLDISRSDDGPTMGQVRGVSEPVPVEGGLVRAHHAKVVGKVLRQEDQIPVVLPAAVASHDPPAAAHGQGQARGLLVLAHGQLDRALPRAVFHGQAQLCWQRARPVDGSLVDQCHGRSGRELDIPPGPAQLPAVSMGSGQGLPGFRPANLQSLLLGSHRFWQLREGGRPIRIQREHGNIRRDG